MTMVALAKLEANAPDIARMLRGSQTSDASIADMGSDILRQRPEKYYGPLMRYNNYNLDYGCSPKIFTK